MTSPGTIAAIERALEGGVTPDRLRYEADAMYAAVNGEEYGDTFHWQNWSDKHHRVVFDAVELLRSAAEQVTALARKASSAEARVSEMERENAELLAALKPFAECASEWEGEPDSLHVFFEWNDESAPVPSLPVADFRRARALSLTQENSDDRNG